MSTLTFRDRQKEKYSDSEFKKALFSKDARARGTYKGHEYDFCLADAHSWENLHQSLRDEAIAYFLSRHIQWHDGKKSRTLPSNHLCCSQSCCVNFLFPMHSNDRLLAAVFKAIYPEMRMPLPMVEGDVGDDGGAPLSVFRMDWVERLSG